ncbi:Hpt domain-containing protein [Pseudoalteromonas sp.]|jgi:HPt (histidine-containing phosphotransfer) domain-containing protein|uniref:Hpt domain-containing protein n=1 Tax=Pseudoalteromonas sp. TaxID=53249 RepID=UPI00356A540D
MSEININESALESMESLLGEQFAVTLEFCCSEFERLGSEVLATIGHDKEASIRHAHSLKSNAAQFGAVSLAEVAGTIEQQLNNDDLAAAISASQQLMTQVTGSHTLLKNWLAAR